VESVLSVPTQCIQVDSPDSLYVCSEGYLLTHNTGKYKTPRPGCDDDYGDQMRLYTLAAAQAYGIQPSKATLYYTEPGKSRSVSVSKKELDKTAHGFAKSWNTLNKSLERGYFDTKTSPLCGWCPLVATCERAISEGYVERAGKMDVALALDVRRIDEPAAFPAVDVVTGEVFGGEEHSEVESVADATREEELMSAYDVIEGNIWEPTVEGAFNPASTAANNVFGLVQIAFTYATQIGCASHKGDVREVTRAIDAGVRAAQEDVAGTATMRNSMYSQILRLVPSVLEVMDPYPLEKDSDPDEVAMWAKKFAARLIFTTDLALDVFFDEGA